MIKCESQQEIASSRNLYVTVKNRKKRFAHLTSRSKLWFPFLYLEDWLFPWPCSHPVRTACVLPSSRRRCSPWLLPPVECEWLCVSVSFFLHVLLHICLDLKFRPGQGYVLMWTYISAMQIKYTTFLLSHCMYNFHGTDRTHRDLDKEATHNSNTEQFATGLSFQKWKWMNI